MIAAVNWQYVILNGGGGGGGSHRVARQTASGHGPTTFQSGTDSPSGTGWSRTAPPSIYVASEDRRYVFAFWSLVARDATSAQTAAQIVGNQYANESFTGGTWTVTATAYYVWDFGGGGGPNALLIDAFDVTAGAFIPDDFVDVSPDPTFALTADANDGYVDTSDGALTQGSPPPPYTVAARDMLPGKKFGYWFPVGSLTFANDPANPPTIGTPNDHDIVIHFNDIVVAFAFYDEVEYRGRVPRVPNNYNPWWWIETHGGLGPDDPALAAYVAGLALARLAAGVAPELQRDVLELAHKQLNLAAASIKKQIDALAKASKGKSKR